MALKYWAPLTQIQLDLEMELYLRTEFTLLISFVKKYILNLVNLSELGRFPLYYDIIKSIFHYWNRLQYLDKISFTTKGL
jgi:hypothetical protein